MRKIVLASTSLPRKQILSKSGLKFAVRESSFEEDMTLRMSPEKLAEHLSAARAIAENCSDALVIAADTFIAYKNQKLGKPKTAKRAAEMLRMLSGKRHKIITGVTIIDTKTGKTLTFHETTKIFMKKMSPAEIAGYVATGEPLHKAAGYALQERGAVFIKKIDGDFFNAMGLPIARLMDELKKFGVRVF